MCWREEEDSKTTTATSLLESESDRVEMREAQQWLHCCYILLDMDPSQWNNTLQTGRLGGQECVCVCVQSVIVLNCCSDEHVVIYMLTGILIT